MGAVVGAAIGLVADMVYGVGGELAGVTREARRRAPEAMDWAASVTADARRRLRDSDLPEQARALAEDIVESDFARQVASTTSEAAVSGRRAVRTALENVRDATR